ncbi:MAG TPA: amidohydrolase family protein [Acidobacteriaceae bacterium]|jgi:L-fuconolactonase|nr:amidohydrolase family protein [Acidobacteriaceae bacterium]
MIDAHHHLWRYNDRDYTWMNGAMSALRRDFLVPDLEAVTRDTGVDGTVAVQARQTVDETEFLLDLATHHPIMRGVVGWVPLCEPDVATHLERYAANPRCKGVRHVLHDEPDDFFMLRDDFNRGIRLLRPLDLVYDILIFERHLPQTIEFVDRHPGQIFVVDHIAKPRIKDGTITPWRENLTELARRDNVYCKISGMATEADWHAWTTDQLHPYFDVVLAAFGPQRLMFGSDWPVLTLAGSYRRWVDTVHSFIADLSPTERDDITQTTAMRAYRLA